jgi:ribulose-5-phosphate 4-epimerase/fuculose-1-phosphate aldolase
MNAVEWQTRVDLAAANCIVNHHGWTSQVYNHITARIPGTDELLLREWPACLRLQDRLDP